MPEIHKATHGPARPQGDLQRSEVASGASSAPREPLCSAQGTLSRGAEAYCSDTTVAAAYRSAGVLPVAGSDFGGRREQFDVDVEATAGREFAEETLGLFNGTAVDACSVDSSALQMADQLRQRTKCLRIVSQLREGCYVMFVALTEFVDSIFFHLATQQNCYKQRPMPGAEKIAFAWVALDELLAELKGKAGCFHLYLEVNSSGTRHHYRGSKKHIRLHPNFARSLRLAQGAGLEELAAQASKRVVSPKWLPEPSSRAKSAESTLDYVDPKCMLYWLGKARVAAELKGESNCTVPWPSEEDALQAGDVLDTGDLAVEKPAVTMS